MRWGRYWRLLHSLLARRRAWRRKLPNRPVVKSVIGGVIDEQRKIATVLEIIDATHWRGEWNGQVYECRSFPDTSSLAVGDAVVVHAMPGTTELWYSYRPSVGGPELWFSPGSDSANERGQVWRAYPTPGGVAYTDYTIEQVWQGTDDHEYVTHICWAKPTGAGYVFTWWNPGGGSANRRLRVYRITQDLVAPSITLVTEARGNDLGIDNGFGGELIDPIIDTAQFLNNILCINAGYYASAAGRILWFDLTTETFSVSFDFDLEIGFGGGIATDSGNGVCFGHDGMDLYRTDDGVIWTHLADIHALTDCNDVFSMLTEYTTPLVYGGLFTDDMGPPEKAAFTLDAGENFAVDFTLPDPADFGFVALANQWNAAGTITDTWAQQWGYWGGAHGMWSKPLGGAWAMDWAGPADDVPGPGEWPPWWQGLGQGVVYYDTKMWGLYWDGEPASPTGSQTRLYRRDGAGNWTLVQTFTDRLMVLTTASVTGMAPLPSVGAGAVELAAMRRQHEVN